MAPWIPGILLAVVIVGLDESFGSQSSRQIKDPDCLPPSNYHSLELVWLPCSTTCGPGVQQAKMICRKSQRLQHGKQLITKECSRSCQVARCPVVEEWGQWSSCQGDCGNGVTTRTTACNDPDDTGVCQPGEETKTCPTGVDCPHYEFQGDWGKCTAPCEGTGTQHQVAVCVDSDKTGRKCDGEPQAETRTCVGEPCQLPSSP